MSGMIQWPTAKYWTKAWNPYIGCKACSPACVHCYAKAWAARFGIPFEPHPTMHGLRGVPKKGVVFCGNMTDAFGEWVRPDLREEALMTALAHGGRGATYLWLTKRVLNMVETVSNVGTMSGMRSGMEDNHFFGYTGENQEWFDKRQKESMGLPTWANLWYSLEPLLGPIYMGAALVRSSLKWVVVGAESGPNRRPCGLGWVASIVAQCQSAGVPVFVKQLCLPDGRFTNRIEEFPEHLRIRQVPWAKEGGK